MNGRFGYMLMLIGTICGATTALGQTCARPAAECNGILHCGGQWDFESGFYSTGHPLAGQCQGPPTGGNVFCVPGDKTSTLGNGWSQWASFPTWFTGGFWGTCSFNENKNCENVFRGNRSQELTLTCANGVGVIYKTATVPANHRIRVEAYMKFTPNGGEWPDVEHAIGIDPSGGTNPASASVQWTNWQEQNPAPPQPGGVFNKGTADAVSLGTTLTVMIRQRAFEPPCMGQTFLVDNVKVIDLGFNGPILNVQPGTLSPVAISGADAVLQTFTVSNTGPSSLTYAITDNADWLIAAPSSGSSSGEADDITVTYSTANLPVGTHTATITVTSPEAVNPPQTLGVTLTITAKPADFDADGDVDQADFGSFQACFSGPGITQPNTACVGADFDHDTDVDQEDFSRFQACMSGPGVLSNPNCAQ